MEKIYYDKVLQKVPIKCWATDLEQGALEQAKNLSKLPFVFKHMALMPDCHQGFGMPIGGVIATKDYIIPNAVGKDISCGMIAIKTSIKVEEFSKEKLKEIMGEIRKRVPVGFNHHNNPCDISEMPNGKRLYSMDANNSILPICSREFNSAMKQLGTLGGGNHFIEIQKGDDGFIWIMIHSGSRNLGMKVADYYNKIAVDLNSKWFSEVNKEKELAFLPVDSEEGQSYLEEMNYCVQFALANRNKMINECKEIFISLFPNIKFENYININHNYASLENHFGKNVWVHRKGATSAKKGELGIIPGSQGTCSYIVEGLGDEESFMSCSHGAGRKMGRKEAQRSLNLQNEIKTLNEKGILHSIRNSSDLDEAPGSYKDIDVVMENQKDLVKIVTKLEPLGVIKG